MSFTAQDVVKLREKTGAGMMECKNALKDSNGDIEKATELLRQKGLSVAAKKSDKSATEGIVASAISADKKSGVIIEINTQTDFVAKNDLFIEMSKKVSEIVLKNKPKNLDDLQNVQIEGTTVSEFVKNHIAKIGENIKIRRFNIFDLSSENGVIGSYIHPVGNKIGVLVKIKSNNNSAELEALAKDIAMHIAASQPQPEYIDRTQIPAEIIENEKRIELGKEDLAKKPKEIAEKIVQGRLDKILAQRCLVDQPFIKDPSFTVDSLIKEKNKQLNLEIKIAEFIRFNVGESTDKTETKEEKSTVGV